MGTENTTNTEVAQANAAVEQRRAELVRTRAVVNDLSDVLKNKMNDPEFPVSTDETRPFLTGVYVVFEGHDGRLVATDGGRLALRTAKLTKSVREKISAIVPSKTMAELVRALGAAEGEVTITAHENQLIFAVGSMRFISRLIAGQFPPYEKVIPSEFKQRIKVGTERLLRAVRRASITARDSANVVRLSAAERTLTVSSTGPMTRSRPTIRLSRTSRMG